MEQLKDTGWRATETIRDNRTNRCPLVSVNDMKKKEKGFIDFRSDGTVLVCRWRGNAVVSVAGTTWNCSKVG